MPSLSSLAERFFPRESRKLYAIGLASVVFLGYAVINRFVVSTAASVGKSAPDFVLPVIYNGDSGDMVQLSNLEGETVVLSFWATWCQYCRMMTPAVEKLSRDFGDKGISVISINTMDQPSNAIAYAEQVNVSFPIVSDADGTVGNAFGVRTLPTTVVVGKDGVVKAKRVGAMNLASLESLALSAR